MQTFSFPTVEEVIELALGDALGSSNRSPSSLQTPALVRKLDSINSAFINAAYTREPAEGWEWMEEVYNFQTFDNSTTSADITTASTSIPVTDSSEFPSSGKAWILSGNNAVDFVDYSTNAANTLGGVTGIGINHSSGREIGICYALPLDYGKVKSVSLNGFSYSYRKFIGLPVAGHFYTRGAYLVFPQATGDGVLIYSKAPKKIYTDGSGTDTAKVLDIPTDYMNYAVELLKSHIFYVTGEDQSQSIALAQGVLNDALNYNVTTTTSYSLHASY